MKIKAQISFIITCLIFCSCKEEVEYVSESKNIHIPSLNQDFQDDCKIDYNQLDRDKYSNHIAIHEILNGHREDSLVDGKLFTMFQFMLDPKEASIGNLFTNQVIFDILQKGDSTLKFHLDNQIFKQSTHDYIIYHLTNPLCILSDKKNVFELIKMKIIATSEKTERAKRKILDIYKDEEPNLFVN